MLLEEIKSCQQCEMTPALGKGTETRGRLLDRACSSHFQTLRSCNSVKSQKLKYANENQPPEAMA